MQLRIGSLIVLTVVTGLLAACTTRVPAPVVDRSVRPAVVAAPDPRALPPSAVTAIDPTVPGNTAGSQFHVVQRGETLYGIARVNNIDVTALGSWNNIVAGQTLRDGQVLRLSAPLGSAPAITGAGTTITAIAATGPILGQPLPSGTPLPAATAAAVAAPSLTPLPTPIEVPLKREPKSQRLAYSDAALAALQRGDALGASTANELRGAAPSAATTATLATAPSAAASAPSSASGSAVEVEVRPGNGVERDGIAWTWPTSGKVASKFSDKAPMKGIDIAANAGTAVVAAASGKVIYVGKEPRGYGQMIVVNHAKETVSVYFHTDKVQVKEQQRVLLGQKLAEVADSAGNKMHFEVRRQGRPLDPVALMPR